MRAVYRDYRTQNIYTCNKGKHSTQSKQQKKHPIIKSTTIKYYEGIIIIIHFEKKIYIYVKFPNIYLYICLFVVQIDFNFTYKKHQNK